MGHGGRALVAIWSLSAMLAFSACGAPPGGQEAAGDEATVPEESPPVQDVASMFELDDGREMYLECTGSGSPRVLFISGLRGSAQDWSLVADGVKAAPVFKQVSEQTRACAYDRPGTPVGQYFSRSDPVAMPTTVGAMVDDLHELLEVSGETGPTVVVGHSIGGMAARLYAGTYPEKVDGLVFVDSTSTGIQDAMTAEQWKIQRKLLIGDTSESEAQYPNIERVDIDPSFEQVRAADPLQQMPLVVITADKPWGPIVEEQHAAGQLLPGIPPKFGYVLDKAAAKAQAGLAALLPGSKHITDTNAGHNVHQEQPQLVSDEVLTVVDLVREGADSAGG
ncbi:alpha/beta fold hydrolase [Arthrobacter pigmenti]